MQTADFDFRLNFDGQQTADIKWDASAVEVQSKLSALSNVPSNGIKVEYFSGRTTFCDIDQPAGLPPARFTFESTKDFIGDVPSLVLTSSSETLVLNEVQTIRTMTASDGISTAQPEIQAI